MKISQLRDNLRHVDVEGIISDISEPRVVNLKSGEQARVADCILKDDSGSVALSLWDDQIEAVKEGSRVRIENGYTSSFRGQLRLNVGRYGRLKVLEH